MNEQSKLVGLFPVVPTPLHEDESFDNQGFKALLDQFIDCGFHGFTILGSNGEGTYFSKEEKVKIINTASEHLGRKANWIAGTGSLSTRETVELTDHAYKAGAAACLVTLPTFFSLKFDDIYDHYKKTTEKTGSPVLFYNYPACTGINLSVKEVIRLSECEGIVGIKETILNMKTIRAHIRRVKKKPFSVFAGTSYFMAETLKAGGAGVICPVALLQPENTIALYNAIRENDTKEIVQRENTLFKTLPLFTGKSLPSAGYILKTLANLGLAPEATGGSAQAMLKELLRLSGIPITSRVRSPLPQLTAQQKKHARRLYDILSR